MRAPMWSLRKLPVRLMKVFVPGLAVVALFVGQALPASACGSLLAPNGAIRLSRAATLVEWHNGIEHYMTSFTYQGDVSNLGWIVPLPAVPLKIEEGGGWTLQRLFRETHPLPENSRAVFAGATDAATHSAIVLQEVQIQALNIKVVKGSGDEIVTWALDNGFFVDEDTRGHLLSYAKGTAIFMAAKYDTSAARARGQLQGDGAPVLITLPVPHPWIPLEVLALDKQEVHADIYLLSDQPVYTTDLGASIGQSAVNTDIPNAQGFRMSFQEKMTPALYKDLSTDKNMGWVRPDSWLTYLTLDSDEPHVTYDMGVSSSGVIRLAPFGTTPMDVATRGADAPLPVRLPLGTPQTVALLAILLGVFAVLALIVRLSLRSANTSTPSRR